MPVTKTAIRELRAANRKTEVNKNRRSAMRTFIKKVEKAIAAGNKDEAATAFKAAQPKVQKAAAKGMIHKNQAARKLSRLSAQIKKLAA